MRTDPPRWELMIHGGAGRIERYRLSPDADAATRAGLRAALTAGAAVLDRDGDALDAVEAAVKVLEDDPCFNAGRGAALTWDGGVELDASVMRGDTRAAGAVAGVTAARHPVTLARAVMEQSAHVLLAGAGADAFARAQGVEAAAPGWFVTPERQRHLAELKAAGGGYDAEMKYGTVGAVARDAHGHLAAATSTGGVTGKRWSRIGDSPVPGAGTWADDRGAAVSCTGTGEAFLRVGVAQAIETRIRLLGEASQEAADTVLAEVTALGGVGGVIVMTGAAMTWRFTTPGMNRASLAAGGTPVVALYGDEG